MRIHIRLRSLWWNLIHRGRVNAALDEELGTYTALLAAEYERQGVSPSEARRMATIEMGGAAQVKDAVRDAWLGNTIELLARDIRYSVRGLRRAAGFTVVAVLTLALGIGGSTAVFSIIDAELLRPPSGVVDPSRLVSLQRVQPKATLDNFSYPDFQDLRAHTRTLSGLAAHTSSAMRLYDAAGSSFIMVDFVSGNYFAVTGAHTALGRALTEADAAPNGSGLVAVLSYDFWKAKLEGDSAVLGRTLDLDHVKFTVVGVAAPDFDGTETGQRLDVWVPLNAYTAWESVRAEAHWFDDRGAGWLELFGRLAPGATVANAQQDLAVAAAQLAASYQTNVGRTMRVLPGVGTYPDDIDRLRQVFLVLGGAVTLLLLLACANVAGLCLVRASSRQRELASRLALGASHASLFRQLCIEGFLIALAAATVGTAGALLLVHSPAVVAETGVSSMLHVGLDWRVLAFALGAATLTAVLVSMFPAIRVGRVQAMSLLKSGTAGSGRRRSTAQRSLVALQLCISLVLLAVAQSVVGAFHRLTTMNPGFDPRNVLSGVVNLGEQHYDRMRALALYHNVLNQASAEPGVESAALATIVPPSRWATRSAVFRPENAPPPGALSGHTFELGLLTYVDAVSPSFFGTLHISLLAGRSFTNHDDAGAPAVAIVNRRLAERLWPHENPIGKYIAWPKDDGTPRPALRVVGLAGDTRHAVLTDTELPPVMYVSLFQQPDVGQTILLLRGRAAAPIERTLRRIVAAADPAMSVYGVETMDERLIGSLWQQRTMSIWVGVFSVFALLLASIGLYGVAAQSVLQRRRELAVRTAVGATPANLAALVLREGVWLAAAGGAVGVPIAIFVARAVQRSVPGVGAMSISALSGCVALLAGVMLMATYIPARRAARIDPARVLRSD